MPARKTHDQQCPDLQQYADCILIPDRLDEAAEREVAPVPEFVVEDRKRVDAMLAALRDLRDDAIAAQASDVAL